MQALVDYSGSDSDSDSDGRRRSSSDSSRDSLEHEGENDTAKKYPHTAAASTSTRGGKKDIGLISAADLFAAEVDTVYLKKPKAEFEVQPTEQEQKRVCFTSTIVLSKLLSVDASNVCRVVLCDEYSRRPTQAARRDREVCRVQPGRSRVSSVSSTRQVW